MLSQLDNTSNSPVYGEYKCCWRGGLWCTFGGLWCRMWQFSIFIGNRRKHKTTDIWRCANEDQRVPDKRGCSCRTTTRSVRLAMQGCWCCACRSSSPVLHESYCRITSYIEQACKRAYHVNRYPSKSPMSNRGPRCYDKECRIKGSQAVKAGERIVTSEQRIEMLEKYRSYKQRKKRAYKNAVTYSNRTIVCK